MNGHTAADHLGPDIDWRAADVAVQPGWGYYPTGGVELIVLILIILLLTGRL